MATGVAIMVLVRVVLGSAVLLIARFVSDELLWVFVISSLYLMESPG